MRIRHAMVTRRVMEDCCSYVATAPTSSNSKTNRSNAESRRPRATCASKPHRTRLRSAASAASAATRLRRVFAVTNTTHVLNLLRAALPAQCIVTDARAKKPFETDGLTAVREVPWVVTLPETVPQLRAIVAICREHGVPLVPRGGGTGLSGGARPLADGVW